MVEVAACTFCGSSRIYPKIWVQGFLATVDGEREVYVCKDCGKEGLLLLFSTEEERRRFEAECRKGTS